MSAIDNAIAQLEHDLELAAYGRIVDVDRIERRLTELRKERGELFVKWLEDLPRPTFTMPNFDPKQPQGWELTAMDPDETQQECEERRNRGL